MENGFQLDFTEIKICYYPHLLNKKCQWAQPFKSNSLGQSFKVSILGFGGEANTA